MIRTGNTVSYRLLYVVLLLAAGCTMLAKSDPELPADWPIPQLTLPAEIKVKAGPAAMHEKDPSLTDKEWIVGFNKDDNWPAMIDHVETCLKPLGYWRAKHQGGADNPLGLDLPEVRNYYSPDYLIEVRLSHGAYFDVFGPKNLEFALWVVQRTEPAEIIQACLDAGKARQDSKMSEQLLTSILEPIE